MITGSLAPNPCDPYINYSLFTKMINCNKWHQLLLYRLKLYWYATQRKDVNMWDSISYRWKIIRKKNGISIERAKTCFPHIHPPPPYHCNFMSFSLIFKIII